MPTIVYTNRRANGRLAKRAEIASTAFRRRQVTGKSSTVEPAEQRSLGYQHKKIKDPMSGRFPNLNYLPACTWEGQ